MAYARSVSPAAAREQPGCAHDFGGSGVLMVARGPHGLKFPRSRPKSGPEELAPRTRRLRSVDLTAGDRQGRVGQSHPAVLADTNIDQLMSVRLGQGPGRGVGQWLATLWRRWITRARRGEPRATAASARSSSRGHRYRDQTPSARRCPGRSTNFTKTGGARNSAPRPRRGGERALTPAARAQRLRRTVQTILTITASGRERCSPLVAGSRA